MAVVIGKNDYFGFGFTTLIENRSMLHAFMNCVSGLTSNKQPS